MPYTNEQKKQHIKEIQTYLYSISMYKGEIPPVYPDGIYGESSEEAVRAFQDAYELHVTGNVDPETWDRIVEVYKKCHPVEVLPYSCFPTDKRIIKAGEKGEIVYIIQAMLDGLRGKFDDMPRVSVSGEYDEATAEAVSCFQERTGLVPSGAVGIRTWNLLAKSCEHCRRMIK